MAKVGPKDGLSNAAYASQNGKFIAACEKAGVKPTPRQASKFRNKYGAAWNAVRFHKIENGRMEEVSE